MQDNSQQTPPPSIPPDGFISTADHSTYQTGPVITLPYSVCCDHWQLGSALCGDSMYTLLFCLPCVRLLSVWGCSVWCIFIWDVCVCEWQKKALHKVNATQSHAFYFQQWHGDGFGCLIGYNYNYKMHVYNIAYIGTYQILGVSLFNSTINIMHHSNGSKFLWVTVKAFPITKRRGFTVELKVNKSIMGILRCEEWKEVE